MLCGSVTAGYHLVGPTRTCPNIIVKVVGLHRLLDVTVQIPCAAGMTWVCGTWGPHISPYITVPGSAPAGARGHSMASPPHSTWPFTRKFNMSECPPPPPPPPAHSGVCLLPGAVHSGVYVDMKELLGDIVALFR